MNLKKTALLVILLPLCLYSNGQTYISGELKGNFQGELSIYSPINGFANTTLLKDGSVIPIDSSGQFRYKLDLKDPCFITLKIGYEPIWLLIQPNDSLYIKVNLDSLTIQSHRGWLQISGNNSDGHLYFNEYNFQPYNKLIPITNLFASINRKPIDLVKAIRDTLSNALEPLHLLLVERRISQAYYTIVSTTIKANLLDEAFKYFFRGSPSLYAVYSIKEIDNMKKSLFSLCNPFDTTLYKGWNTYFYLHDFYLEKELEKKKKILSKELGDSILNLSDGKKLLIHGEFAPFLQIPDRRLQENLWGNLLYSITVTTGTPPDAQSVESFSFLYPKSPWLFYLNRFIAKIKERQDKNPNHSEKIKYLDSTQTISSFAEITKQLKNKPLFIDIWASWCIPCRQEFLSKNSVDSFLSEKGITKVYISIDISMAKKSWNDAIKMYDLEGYHILAGSKLIQELINKIYDGDKRFPIPKYVIVNRDGIIVEKDALRPSTDSKLIEQIEKVLQVK